MKVSKSVRNAAWTLLGLAFGSAANAQLREVEAPVAETNFNLIGLVVASVPDYSGSDNHKGAAGPIFRYQFEGSERYFAWLGPTMTLNLLNDREWRLGPLLNFRAERSEDTVDDEVVKNMDKIDSKVEAGAFVQYRLKLSNQPFHEVLFTGDAAGSDNGTVGHLRAMYFHPVNEQLVASIGLGTTFSDDKFARTYYGVRSAHDIALFPSLHGQRYDAKGGFIGVDIPFSLTYFVDKRWMIIGGGRYESLQGDAKDSPIVDNRGSSDQWMLGIGAAYRF